MNEREKSQEWVRFYKASPQGYEMNALLAVLHNDGPQMLSRVLKGLGLLQSVDLVKSAYDSTRFAKPLQAPRSGNPALQASDGDEAGGKTDGW